jgi:hypothetical protein
MNEIMCIGSLMAGFVLMLMGYALIRMGRRLDDWDKRERRLTSIYPSVNDDTTASGYHEESRRA